MLDALPGKIERLRTRLAERVAPLPHVGDVRQRGLMVGIELVADRATREPFPPRNAAAGGPSSRPASGAS